MVSARVVPLTQTVSTGEIFQVAVVFSMEPGWHTYWRNPGEAGMPTHFDWSLPNGFKVIKQQEPTPTRHVDEGISSFIHKKEAIYLFDMQAPPELADSSHFGLDINWLECKGLCRPGSSHQDFSLGKSAVPASPSPEGKALLARAITKFPEPYPGAASQLVEKGDHLELRMKRSFGGDKLQAVDFFPYTEMVFDPEKLVQFKRGFRKDIILIPLLEGVKAPDRLQGVLVQSYASAEGTVTTNSIINQPLP